MILKWKGLKGRVTVTGFHHGCAKVDLGSELYHRRDIEGPVAIAKASDAPDRPALRQASPAVLDVFRQLLQLQATPHGHTEQLW